MTLSEQTEAVLAYFDHYTGHNVRKRADIGAVLETASTQDAAEEFNGIVFAGKIVWNLYNTLRKITSGQEGYQHVEREFSSAVQDFREKLLFFVATMPTETQQRFSDIYLGVGQGTMRNIVDMAHDLARFKDMQADSAPKE
jgi:hypothetical protein